MTGAGLFGRAIASVAKRTDEDAPGDRLEPPPGRPPPPYEAGQGEKEEEGGGRSNLLHQPYDLFQVCFNLGVNGDVLNKRN